MSGKFGFLLFSLSFFLPSFIEIGRLRAGKEGDSGAIATDGYKNTKVGVKMWEKLRSYDGGDTVDAPIVDAGGFDYVFDFVVFLFEIGIDCDYRLSFYSPWKPALHPTLHTSDKMLDASIASRA
ncbi:hypothetical protein L2E82_19409 [Cichorium intybus]|uniref:Uncharacterized protein n=1 Tax=Cichorium intybus TaxID=13427 RepID=A0ACB9FD14_CICIN|nr:hypothetical protein L2E82_19409 [Cichorium intybus]